MRVLIDECLNWRLGRALRGHFCTSVQRMGWSGIKNGELLDKMRHERFDVFITGDRNLQFQQHRPAPGVAVVVLRAGSTRLAETLSLMKKCWSRLNRCAREQSLSFRIRPELCRAREQFRLHWAYGATTEALETGGKMKTG